MNRYVLALVWSSLGFTGGALATLRIPVWFAISISAGILVIILITSFPRVRKNKKRRFPTDRKTGQRTKQKVSKAK